MRLCLGNRELAALPRQGRRADVPCRPEVGEGADLNLGQLETPRELEGFLQMFFGGFGLP